MTSQVDEARARLQILLTNTLMDTIEDEQAVRTVLDEIDALAFRLQAAEARTGLLESALTAAIEIADQARDEWDVAPQGMKAGKLLIALSGKLPGYRPDIDAIHRIHKPPTEPADVG